MRRAANNCPFRISCKPSQTEEQSVPIYLSIYVGSVFIVVQGVLDIVLPDRRGIRHYFEIPCS